LEGPFLDLGSLTFRTSQEFFEFFESSVELDFFPRSERHNWSCVCPASARKSRNLAINWLLRWKSLASLQMGTARARRSLSGSQGTWIRETALPVPLKSVDTGLPVPLKCAPFAGSTVYRHRSSPRHLPVGQVDTGSSSFHLRPDSYAVHADCYGSLPIGGDADPNILMPMAQAAAKKAVELDDSLAEAYTSQVRINLWYEWNWRKLEQEASSGPGPEPQFRRRPFSLRPLPLQCQEAQRGAGRSESS